MGNEHRLRTCVEKPYWACELRFSDTLMPLSQERLIPTYDELEGALCRLVLAGEIQEAGPTRFYKSEHGQERSNFSGFSEADFNTAYRTYKEAVSKWLEKMGDEPTGKMVIRCRLMFAGAARGSEAAETAANELADQIRAALPAIAGSATACEAGRARHHRRHFGRGESARGAEAAMRLERTS